MFNSCHTNVWYVTGALEGAGSLRETLLNGSGSVDGTHLHLSECGSAFRAPLLLDKETFKYCGLAMVLTGASCNAVVDISIAAVWHKSVPLVHHAATASGKLAGFPKLALARPDLTCAFRGEGSDATDQLFVPVLVACSRRGYAWLHGMHQRGVTLSLSDPRLMEGLVSNDLPGLHSLCPRVTQVCEAPVEQESTM
ncbi:hypothetical protein KIPB_008358 [Kipferlia bialata]|uniref:Uncharacterized protein n=1 Tax=Kipferlia bialata TaxID=797122 RepID=A0A9K3D0H3_9EUKA|nr:hypothetical protein KIPB_008358 [Kipferlia bialata]|eukprot:g8358.t1